MVDIANLVIQTLIGIATFAAVCISMASAIRKEASRGVNSAPAGNTSVFMV